MQTRRRIDGPREIYQRPVFPQDGVRGATLGHGNGEIADGVARRGDGPQLALEVGALARSQVGHGRAVISASRCLSPADQTAATVYSTPQMDPTTTSASS
jgi:hypothetical protein